MSASPSQLTQSSKRPLEEPSSPSRATDQPDAKRPALDKTLKKNEEVKIIAAAPDENENDALGTNEDDTNGEKSNGVKDESAEVSAEVSAEASTAESEPKPIATTTTSTAVLSSSTVPANSQDETAWLHIRAVISSPEAATVIGKGGENVSNIRKLSGAKCTVSDFQKGAVERILTVSGLVDAAAKAFGLIIRTLNNEPLDEASTAQSKTYPLRLLVPHILIGSIIGKGGARIREIQEASGARLNASDSCLPLSSERSLVVMGVADAVHIATYYVGSTLLEQYNSRWGGPSASAYAKRSGGQAAVVPGGLQVVPYEPPLVSGMFGSADNYKRNQGRQPQFNHDMMAKVGMAMPGQFPAQLAGGRYGGVGRGQMPVHFLPHGADMHSQEADKPTTRQISIPNEYVGAIIGKGGANINEIRSVSEAVIKINEPQDGGDRLINITGTEGAIKMALGMLTMRLNEVEQRQQRAGSRLPVSL